MKALGPDGVLAIAAIAILAAMAAALGGALRVPWDGIVPFAIIAAALVAMSAVVDIVLAVHAHADGWRAFARRQLRAVRLFTPFAVVYLCYRALRGALPALVDGGHEDALRAADIALLGSSPAWSLSAIHAPWLTELLAYAYATMFFLPLAVLLGLHAKQRDREVRHVALALQLAFYLGFVGFLVVPARSPDVVYPFATALEGHGFFEASMRAWRTLQAITYDAFPSMHTAISTLALAYAWRLRHALSPRRPALPVALLAPIVALLQLATLYLRQHYFVDLLAGWTVAALAMLGAHALDRAWRRDATRECQSCPTLQVVNANRVRPN